MRELEKFFHGAEVIPAREVFSDADENSLVIHVDNQIYLLKILYPHPGGWGYFELYKRINGEWRLIVAPLLELE
jgi:hypothetical protein